MKLARLLALPPGEAARIEDALAQRRMLTRGARREMPAPALARASVKAAILWTLGAIRQDNPIFFWLGLTAAAANLLYIVAAGVAGLLR